MREKVKLLLEHALLLEHTLLLEHAVFGAAEMDNRTFEGESFFNGSSVSHVKHVTVKRNLK